MGGAMFPTAFKISSGRGKVDTLIINGAECEPYLCGDHRTMLEAPGGAAEGYRARCASPRAWTKCYYGIEKNKQDAIDLLSSLDPAKYGIEIVPEEVKYPQGAEKMQVKVNTNREVKPGGLPAAWAATSSAPTTAYSIYRACYEGVPAIERVVHRGRQRNQGAAEPARALRHAAGAHLQRGRRLRRQRAAHLHGAGR